MNSNNYKCVILIIISCIQLTSSSQLLKSDSEKIDYTMPVIIIINNHFIIIYNLFSILKISIFSHGNSLENKKYLDKIECNEICAQDDFQFNNYCCLPDNYLIKSEYFPNGSHVLTIPCCDMFEFIFFEEGRFTHNLMYVIKNPRIINVIFFLTVTFILMSCFVACFLFWRFKINEMDIYRVVRANANSEIDVISKV